MRVQLDVDDVVKSAAEAANDSRLAALLLIEKTCMDAGFIVQRVKMLPKQHKYTPLWPGEEWSQLPLEERAIRVVDGKNSIAHLVTTSRIQ